VLRLKNGEPTETLPPVTFSAYKRLSRSFCRLRALLQGYRATRFNRSGGVCIGLPDLGLPGIAARKPAGTKVLSRSVTQKADDWRGIALSVAGRGR